MNIIHKEKRWNIKWRYETLTVNTLKGPQDRIVTTCSFRHKTESGEIEQVEDYVVLHPNDIFDKESLVYLFS